MPKEFDVPSGEGLRSVRLSEEGSEVTMQIVDYVPDRIQQKDLDTDELLTWPDGSPKWSTLVVCYVTAGDGAVGPRTAPEPLNPTELVSLWCDGARHYPWKDAYKKFRAEHGRNFAVGDVLHIVREEDTPPKKAAWSPQQNWKMTLRPPETEQERQTADLCERLNSEREQDQRAFNHVPGDEEEAF